MAKEVGWSAGSPAGAFRLDFSNSRGDSDVVFPEILQEHRQGCPPEADSNKL